MSRVTSDKTARLETQVWVETELVSRPIRDPGKALVEGEEEHKYSHSALLYFTEDENHQFCVPEEELEAERGTMTHTRLPGLKTLPTSLTSV